LKHKLNRVFGIVAQIVLPDGSVLVRQQKPPNSEVAAQAVRVLLRMFESKKIMQGDTAIQGDT
jgi:hypothetical protein